MSEKLTVNSLLVLMKEVRSRLGRLQMLQNQSATKERTWFGQEQTSRKEVEPQYDIKALDKKITSLETWLFKADAAIKQANAVTKVDVEVNVDELLSPLE